MTEPMLDHVACADPDGGHRMAYWQWGDARSPHLLLCVHGLTRQGRDFDELARALLARAKAPLRIVCPDVVGRGESDWLRNPQGYQIPTYVGDMLALLAQLHARQPIGRFDFLGTSMGGLIGIALAGAAAPAFPAPLRHLVINDVGPAISWDGVGRIVSYVGQGGHHASLEDGAKAMWRISNSFGPHSDAQWGALSRPMLVPAALRSTDGRAKREAPPEAGGPYVLHYDPAIAQPLRAMAPEAVGAAEAAGWALYDAVRAPTLLVRGAQSDVLLHEAALEMTRRGPRARLVEFEGVGHAPTFVDPAQSRVVADFLFD